VKKIITALQVSMLAIGVAFVLVGCSKDEPASPLESEQPPNPDNPDIPPEPGKK
jgi:PBP1b-binding outer membrane lipoprotein LpoB